MAIRGKIKIVRDTGSGYTGTVKDTANNVDYPFTSPLGREIGLLENMIVRMEVITLDDGTQMAVSLDPVDKGKIESLEPTTNSGTLKDNTGKVIPFNQDYLTELGLKVGDRVSYASVVNSSGGTGGGTSAASTIIATALQKVN